MKTQMKDHSQGMYMRLEKQFIDFMPYLSLSIYCEINGTRTWELNTL